jgi:hypothetical protein
MSGRGKYALRFAEYRWVPRVDVVLAEDTIWPSKDPARIARSFRGFTRVHAFRRALAWKQEQA